MTQRLVVPAVVPLKPVVPAAAHQQKISVAILTLRSAVERFISAAESTTPTARMKMLECSIEVAPAMEAVVKAVTNTT